LLLNLKQKHNQFYMKQLVCLFLGLASLVIIQSCDSNKRANNYNNKALVDDNGLEFLKNGAEASLTSVKASGLAISNSKNQRVIQFAKHMIDDHTLIDSSFKKLESDNFVNDTSGVNPVHMQMISDLEKRHASDFDKAYLQMVIDDNTQQVGLFTNATKNKNTNVADFAQKTVPIIKAHLDSARLISATLK